MTNFVIQKDGTGYEALIEYDFIPVLLHALKFHKWLDPESPFEYTFDRSVMGGIPVGSVEFVEQYLAESYGVKGLKPINVPPQLMKPEYLQRECSVMNREDLPTVFSAPKFVKSADKTKGFVEIVQLSADIPENGNYFVSDVIDIDSEWRAFVFRGELVGLQNYAGDFTLFPDVKMVEEMIGEWGEAAPCAYTLDVGVCKEGTCIIEAHRFYSCGLYGFNNPRILPLMLAGAIREIVREFGKEEGKKKEL